MYHYRECGLQKVWLENGYKVARTPYGEGVSISHVDTLHGVIGRTLAQRPQLTGSELRFLRKEMELSQRSLADMLGVSEQIVSLWERRGRIPKGAARLLKVIYVEHLDGKVKVREMIEQWSERDTNQREELRFRARGGEWRAAA